MEELRFPRQHDGFASAWPGPGERFTPVYEERLQRVAVAIAACGWRPAVEFQGSQDGEAIVAYHPREDYWTYLFQIEAPSEQQHVDQLLAADAAEPGSPEGMFAYLLAQFARVRGEHGDEDDRPTGGGCGNCDGCSCGG